MLLVWGASAQCEFMELTLETTTAEWGAEVSWELYQVMETGDALVASYQGVEDFATSSETLCLEDGCYYLLTGLLGTVGMGQKCLALRRFPVLPCLSPCLKTAMDFFLSNWVTSAVRWCLRDVRIGMP